MKRTILFIALISFVANASFAQDEKTVTLTVSGQGKTQEEAKQNALRNAVEQAFGAFISSNTEILNDQLVKDEIVSISNGNIQKFDILSEVKTPNGEWSNTTKAIVSISKLTSFCENKGVTAEFKGALFAINVKQQVLNEENETSAINNMCSVLSDIGDKSFDYEISVGEPYALNGNTNWGIPVEIKVATNINFQNISTYFNNTLKGISLSKLEVEDYIKLKKQVYTILLEPQLIITDQIQDNQNIKGTRKKTKNSGYVDAEVIYLRNEQSVNSLLEFILGFREKIFNFQITNNVKNIRGVEMLAAKSYLKTLYPEFEILDEGFRILLTNNRLYPDNGIPCCSSIFELKFRGSYDYDYRYSKNYSINISKMQEDYNFWKARTHSAGGYSIRDAELLSSQLNECFPSLFEVKETYTGQLFYDLVISFRGIKSGQLVSSIKFIDKKTLDELSKIAEYSITVDQ